MSKAKNTVVTMQQAEKAKAKSDAKSDIAVETKAEKQIETKPLIKLTPSAKIGGMPRIETLYGTFRLNLKYAIEHVMAQANVKYGEAYGALRVVCKRIADCRIDIKHTTNGKMRTDAMYDTKPIIAALDCSDEK